MTYQKRHDSAQYFLGFWIYWYKMVIGIELIRYQTKYRQKEHQNLPSKKPLVDLFAVILIRYDLITLSQNLIR